MPEGTFMPEDKDSFQKGSIKKEVVNQKNQKKQKKQSLEKGKMDQKNKIAIYKNIVRGLGQVLSVYKIYPSHHPIIKEKSKEVYNELNNFISTEGKLVLSVSSEATLLINGKELISADSPTARFIQTFRDLKIGSIEILPKITLDEFLIFIDLLINVDKLQEEGAIKEFLMAKKVTHIMPSLASYKLLTEDETIAKKGSVKEGRVINVEDLPPDVIENFALDLNTGAINKKIKSGNKVYPILAHDVESLSHAITDNIKTKDQSDQITKILWSIGDYLVDETQTIKQKEINARVLNELKDKLLILYGEKKAKIKMPPIKEVDRTFTTINTALQIKGLISLYAKKIKEQEILLDKIKKIIKELPPESQLSQKAKEEWRRIDHSKFEISLFIKRNKLWLK